VEHLLDVAQPAVDPELGAQGLTADPAAGVKPDLAALRRGQDLLGRPHDGAHCVGIVHAGLEAAGGAACEEKNEQHRGDSHAE
jgi:hypothetical protein